MIQVRRAGAERAPVIFNLGRGATLTARVLDAFDHKLVVAEARAELNAIVADEPTQRAWASLTPERRELMRSSEEVRVTIGGWMHAVLLAAACAITLEGVEEIGEDGASVALSASFEAFELLFTDPVVESGFRLQAYRTEEIWSAEKNVSGPGPNGSGPVETNGAAPAETPAMPAPAAESEAAAESAPSSSTPPAPLTESLPEASPPAAESGAS